MPRRINQLAVRVQEKCSCRTGVDGRRSFHINYMAQPPGCYQTLRVAWDQGASAISTSAPTMVQAEYRWVKEIESSAFFPRFNVENE